jgi:hypothetical protein
MKTGIVLALLALVLVWVWTSGKGGNVIQALFGTGAQTAPVAATATPASTSSNTSTTTTTTAPAVVAQTNQNLNLSDPLLGYAQSLGFNWGSTFGNVLTSSGIAIPNYVGVPSASATAVNPNTGVPSSVSP